MGWKQVGIMLAVVFAVTLAVVIGRQMSTEAMAVVIGVVCGVAAGIPTSFLLFVALTRREQMRGQEAGRSAYGEGAPRPLYRQPGGYPPVVVIQGGCQQPQLPMMPGGYWPAPAPGPSAGSRQFNVVGGEDEPAWHDPYG